MSKKFLRLTQILAVAALVNQSHPALGCQCYWRVNQYVAWQLQTGNYDSWFTCSNDAPDKYEYSCCCNTPTDCKDGNGSSCSVTDQRSKKPMGPRVPAGPHRKEEKPPSPYR